MVLFVSFFFYEKKKILREKSQVFEAVRPRVKSGEILAENINGAGRNLIARQAEQSLKEKQKKKKIRQGKFFFFFFFFLSIFPLF
jgi:hypothetical protein